MSNRTFINADFVRVRDQVGTGNKIIFHLYFGDEVLVEPTGDPDWMKVTALGRATTDGELITGFIKGDFDLRSTPILKASMVDVQQGDGMVVETPSGKIIIIDGGDNKLFARHVAARFRARRSTQDNPIPIEAIIITHGDADHFSGLNDIVESETLTGSRLHKRVFIYPKRILHNGLVKGPSSLPKTQQLGRTVDLDDKKYIVDLFEDIRDSEPAARNTKFAKWLESVEHWSQHGPVEFVRVGDDKDVDNIFDFLAEDEIEIDLHTPHVEQVTDDNGEEVNSLNFLRTPPKTATLHEIELEEDKGSFSAGHTINGHSISFRMKYGNVRFLFTGDLNKDMMAHLEDHFTQRQLEAEILKTPHHGSADFDLAFLKKVRPIVSLISSGDENARKEYIHPRATLMNALGAASRYDTGLIFSTELAAFFKYMKASYTQDYLISFFNRQPQDQFTKEELIDMFRGVATSPLKSPSTFYGFERTQYGLIEIRTDGERVLIFTHSGRDRLFEAYRFRVTKARNGRHLVEFDDKVVKEG